MGGPASHVYGNNSRHVRISHAVKTSTRFPQNSEDYRSCVDVVVWRRHLQLHEPGEVTIFNGVGQEMTFFSRMHMTLEIAFVLVRLDVEFADEDDFKHINANHVTPEDLFGLDTERSTCKEGDPRD